MINTRSGAFLSFASITGKELLLGGVLCSRSLHLFILHSLVHSIYLGQSLSALDLSCLWGLHNRHHLAVNIAKCSVILGCLLILSGQVIFKTSRLLLHIFESPRKLLPRLFPPFISFLQGREFFLKLDQLVVCGSTHSFTLVQLPLNVTKLESLPSIGSAEGRNLLKPLAKEAKS